MHHAVLCVQFGLTAHQSPQNWVQTTFGAPEKGVTVLQLE